MSWKVGFIFSVKQSLDIPALGGVAITEVGTQAAQWRA